MKFDGFVNIFHQNERTFYVSVHGGGFPPFTACKGRKRRVKPPYFKLFSFLGGEGGLLQKSCLFQPLQKYLSKPIISAQNHFSLNAYFGGALEPVLLGGYFNIWA